MGARETAEGIALPIAQPPEAALREVEQFLYREAYLLDSGLFQQWLALYTEDCLYWVPLERGQADGMETCSLIHDDRRLLEVRVRQTRHPRAHARTPHSRTLHQVGNVMLLETSDALYRSLSTLMVTEYRAERQRVFAGQVEHEIVRSGEGLRIRRKRVDLVNSEAELEGIAFLF